MRAMWMAAAILAWAGPALAQDNPILAKVKESVKDPAKPFVMLVSIEAKDAAKFEAAMAKAIGPTRREKGCLAYDLHVDPTNRAKYLLFERWANVASLEAHMQTDHIRTLLSEIGDLLAGPPDLRVLVPVGS